MKTYFRKPRDDRLHLLSDYGKHDLLYLPLCIRLNVIKQIYAIVIYFLYLCI